CSIAFWASLTARPAPQIPRPQHPATLSITASAPPMTHCITGDRPAGRRPDPPPPRAPRTGSAQIGQLSMYGPIGLDPQLGHVLATAHLGGGRQIIPLNFRQDNRPTRCVRSQFFAGGGICVPGSSTILVGTRSHSRDMNSLRYGL